MKIVVVGAGIIGVTTAYELATRGHEVTLLDARGGAGLETSYANGGQLGASEIAPWAGPEVPWLVLRWLGRADAPFRLKLKPDPEQWLWLMRFLMRCRKSARAERVMPNLALALLSQSRMDEMALQMNNDPIRYDERRDGILQIFHRERGLRDASSSIDAMKGAGLDQKVMSARECVDLEPALEPAFAKGNIAGGIFCASDRSGDAHKYTTQLAERAQQLGVAFVSGAEVTGFDSQSDHITGVRTRAWTFSADAVVLAAGVHTARLAQMCGTRIPVYPLKGYSVTLPTEGIVAPQVSLTDEARKVVVSRLGDRLRTAGTAEVSGYDTEIELKRARSVLDATTDIFPQMRPVEDQAEFWTGLRPMTPDGSPILGQAGRFSNLYLNTGHGSLGWTMAAGSAVGLADVICGRVPQMDLSPFNIKRFSFT
ncbi:MAG: D-amino acid dehydrogenase [Parvibaculum sp.]|nr:D-amino acid dehydrogenase [Parvibaculum sp.]